MKFPFYKQHDSMDCGPTCLRMISKFYGKYYQIQTLREKSKIGREGVSMLGISQAAESIGFRTYRAKIDLRTLTKEVPLPCIVHWNQRHFVVVYGIKKSIFSFNYNHKIQVADPAEGLLNYPTEEFLKHWTGNAEQQEGIVLLLEPTPTFFQLKAEPTQKIGFKVLLTYLFAYKKLLFQLVLGLLIGSGLQLILPFLTQSVVDVGIGNANLNFVYLVLVAQIVLFISRISVEFIRSWILLHISTRVNVSILSDFLIKLMRLPLSFFDVKLFGDIMQRVGDHNRIESFLTGQTINTLFITFNFVIFGMVLAFYNIPIFMVFSVATVMHVGWIFLFMQNRRILDTKRFGVLSRNAGALVQLVSGMQDIKLANAETFKRWSWEEIQADLFKVNVKTLSLGQYQQIGASFLNEGKNIFITFLAAQAVINGKITLGEMLSIQYIIGQLNSPVEQLIHFFQTFQDAKISLERLNEIHSLKNETPEETTLINILPDNRSISIQNIFFNYPGAADIPVLKGISLNILQGKTTAIVGTSGSGKTTLLKLILKFYDPQNGLLKVGSSGLADINPTTWRKDCGVVLQDSFIFSDTIAGNISIGDEQADIEKLKQAAHIANIQEFVDRLPLGFNTKVGAEGIGLSQGQKQRILIARAVYKNPHYIFLDEATNSLDATNERIIMEKLNRFFEGRTVIVVAHRLSTVKSADNIIVLENGVIMEQGSHQELVRLKGKYFDLVQDQLELGD